MVCKSPINYESRANGQSEANDVYRVVRLVNLAPLMARLPSIHWITTYHFKLTYSTFYSLPLMFKIRRHFNVKWCINYSLMDSKINRKFWTIDLNPYQ